MNAADTFTGADATDLDGRTLSDGVNVWTARVGTWQIVSNQADPSNTVNAHMTCDPGCADADVSVIIATGAGANLGGVVLRWSDADNYIMALASTTAIRLRTRIAGTEANVTSASSTVGDGDRLRAHAVGDQISIYHTPSGGAESEVIAPQTVAFNQTATIHGIRSTGSTNWKFDDFVVTDLGAGGGVIDNTSNYLRHIAGIGI